MQVATAMGCGASKGSDGVEKEEESKAPMAKGERRQSILKTIPEIKVTFGDTVKLTPLPRVIFIFGRVLCA